MVQAKKGGGHKKCFNFLWVEGAIKCFANFSKILPPPTPRSLVYFMTRPLLDHPYIEIEIKFDVQFMGERSHNEKVNCGTFSVWNFDIMDISEFNSLVICEVNLDGYCFILRIIGWPDHQLIHCNIICQGKLNTNTFIEYCFLTTHQ